MRQRLSCEPPWTTDECAVLLFQRPTDVSPGSDSKEREDKMMVLNSVLSREIAGNHAIRQMRCGRAPGCSR